MTPTETTTILRQFNEWRRGDDDIPQLDEHKVSEAIDAAIGMIERQERIFDVIERTWYKQGVRHPWSISIFFYDGRAFSLGEIKMIDTKELRRLAQAATPGPWYVTGKLTRYVEALIDGGLIQEVAACGPTKADGGYGPQQEANARLIAAANPAAISELLDRLEEAEKERGSAMMLVDRLALALNTSNHERDALRAKIAEMERQEPVAEWLPLDSGEDTRRD